MSSKEQPVPENADESATWRPWLRQLAEWTCRARDEWEVMSEPKAVFEFWLRDRVERWPLPEAPAPCKHEARELLSDDAKRWRCHDCGASKPPHGDAPTPPRTLREMVRQAQLDVAANAVDERMTYHVLGDALRLIDAPTTEASTQTEDQKWAMAEDELRRMRAQLAAVTKERDAAVSACLVNSTIANEHLTELRDVTKERDVWRAKSESLAEAGTETLNRATEAERERDAAIGERDDYSARIDVINEMLDPHTAEGREDHRLRRVLAGQSEEIDALSRCLGDMNEGLLQYESELRALRERMEALAARWEKSVHPSDRCCARELRKVTDIPRGRVASEPSENVIKTEDVDIGYTVDARGAKHHWPECPACGYSVVPPCSYDSKGRPEWDEDCEGECHCCGRMVRAHLSGGQGADDVIGTVGRFVDVSQWDAGCPKCDGDVPDDSAPPAPAEEVNILGAIWALSAIVIDANAAIASRRCAVARQTQKTAIDDAPCKACDYGYVHTCGREALRAPATPVHGNAPACPKCGAANFTIRKRCRDCGTDLVMHPDPDIDAEVRWDAEDGRRSATEPNPLCPIHSGDLECLCDEEAGPLSKVHQ